MVSHYNHLDNAHTTLPIQTPPPTTRIVERSDGPATVLALGTAVPPNVFLQKDYPDFYFNITDSNHQTDLKQKFKRMCK